MKISYSWLENYLNVNLPPKEVAKLLTDIGLEVEGIEEVESIRGGLKGVIIGKILTKNQHPNADRLNITTVDIGSDEPLQFRKDVNELADKFEIQGMMVMAENYANSPTRLPLKNKNIFYLNALLIYIIVILL